MRPFSPKIRDNVLTARRRKFSFIYTFGRASSYLNIICARPPAKQLCKQIIMPRDLGLILK
ncbi:hypothetical protein [Spodoptera cosmioides nucleopolyhedrovirus]|uniref:Uncharacterized protein n=1 Tax=Spodoptera cosmioides nucleopolyhedrovirus TaxID=2605774 RepID=A0A6B7KLE4_9ABAC|nr:hypothetical protein [Spodoptera cosmioides nucleopolyhedrovirus]